MEYVRRVVDDELDELLDGVAAVALEGPRAVGKTATAIRRAATVVRLDLPGQGQSIADSRTFSALSPPVLLDEWQHAPHVWDLVRRAVDADRSPGRFLLTGSAAPISPPTHSGAGRIITLRMRPLSLAERGVTAPAVSLRELLTGTRREVAGPDSPLGAVDYAREIVGSGLPGLRELSGRALRAELDGYLARVVDRDLPEQGELVRRPRALTAWLTAYAAATATTTSYDRIRDAASPGADDKPSRPTITGYRDALTRLWLLDPLPAWLPTRSLLSRLVSAPKHHLADPALAARLLGVDVPALIQHPDPSGRAMVRDGTLLGALFESLVALSVRVYAQAAEARVAHLRTRNGDHEVDLIVERGDGRVVAMEAKLASEVTDRDVRHLHWLRDRIGDDLLDAIVVTAGARAYRRKDGIGVVPAALLGP